MARDQASTILVVEDDTSIQDLLQEVLVEEGYRVLRAADSAHGLHLAVADRPDMILLDIGLPLSSGADMLARLRDDPTTRHIPVVALTGQPLPDGDRPRGFDGWIEKPFDLDVLLEQVGRLDERLDLATASLTTANGRG